MTKETTAQNLETSDTRSGKQLAAESFLDRHLGNAVHLFLSLLAILILAAAGIAVVEIMIRDLPQLWRQSSEYDALRQIIQSILLVAIAAELALLLLSHRTSAAIEVVIFVVGAKDGNAGHLWVGAAAWHGRSRRSHRGALLLLDQERSLRIRWPVVGINFVIP